jgi:hypothetical protein
MTAYNMELDLLPLVVPLDYHDLLPMFTEAIEACRAHDLDRVMCWPDDGEPFARAYKVVELFDLGGFCRVKVQPA